MAVFRSFRAYRPAEDKQSLIPALPYDVMSTEEARQEAKDNPYSFLHVDKAEIDLPPGTDLYDSAVYKKAGENLLKLENSGALKQDPVPCFYIYRQVMNGRSQTGLVGCASIDDYVCNVIKKHEHTLAKKEIDRVRHVDACNANTGPIFLTYRKNDLINNIINNWAAEHMPVYNFFAAGAMQTVWVIDDSDTVARLSNLFKSVDSMYIADGHHRCASAVNVGLQRRKEQENYTGDEEFNYFLAVAFPADQLKIMDYNRVVKDLNGMDEDEFICRLGEKFFVSRSSGQYKPNKKHTFGMLLKSGWYRLEAKKKIIDELDPVKRLDVSILQDNILAPILNITNPKDDDRIDFIGGIRGIGELEKRVADDMELAFAMYPTTVDDLMAIADAGMIMPPKSTWFEPKLLSGLFIHHLS